MMGRQAIFTFERVFGVALLNKLEDPFMEDPEKEFLLLAVKLLFKRMDDGKVKLIAEKVPQTIEAVKAVKFDESGNPVLETITPLVRSLANAVYAQEVEDRDRNSPVRELMGEPVRVDDDALRMCAEQGSFTPLAFELYKETGVILAICSHSYIGGAPGEGGLNRNQAICAGLLVRIVKFMTAVTQLISSADRGEVVVALERSILESAVNLRFLILNNDASTYEQFIRSGLGPERELFDVIQQNIQKRGGEVLPIEDRMLKSIDRSCSLGALKIQEISPKFENWGGGLKKRLEALGEEYLYLTIQRIPSHAIHGSWVDLILYHLEEKDHGFAPNPSWSRVDPRLLCPPCLLVLDAARSYTKAFLGDLPELRPLYNRIDDLRERILRVDEAHEKWFSEHRKRNTHTGTDTES